MILLEMMSRCDRNRLNKYRADLIGNVSTVRDSDKAVMV